MQVELSHTERRLILQGIWKEADMYAKMRKGASNKEGTINAVVEHAEHMIKVLDNLENKLLGW